MARLGFPNSSGDDLTVEASLRTAREPLAMSRCRRFRSLAATLMATAVLVVGMVVPSACESVSATYAEKFDERDSHASSRPDSTTEHNDQTTSTLAPDVSAPVSEERCLASPLWREELDPAKYEYGCNEIEHMLQGNKTLIGHGWVRNVFLVEYDGRLVVVKTLRQKDDSKRLAAHLTMHRREALCLNAVGGHPNIVGMLGVCGTKLVTEYHDTRFEDAVLKSQEVLPMNIVVSMALDIAQGLQALHEAPGGPIVHGDLTPAQLLVDGHTGMVMLNDFNMARFMSATASGSSCPFRAGRPVVILPWTPPETIAEEAMTEKIDIYSAGMIYFTLVSGRVPFDRTESDRMRMLNGEKPEIDPSWHIGFMELVQDMWRREPKDRPSARHVSERLKAIQEELFL